MLHQQAGMARRWERHYPETKATLSVGLVLFGAVIVVVLGIIWPQKLNAEIFNSRLAYRLIMDIEDFWTCDKDFIKFIVDEPAIDEASLSFYMFNVSNAANILERGYKPFVTEVGPYAFKKKAYKYDVYFDPVDSLYVTYKEYTLLEEVTDPEQCLRLYYIMDRNYLSTSDVCFTGGCNCRSTNETLTLLNPMFLKVQHEDSSHSILSQYSLVVFSKIKKLLEEDFVVAVKAHLVSDSLSEVYQFRVQMQFAKLVQRMVDYVVVTQGGTLDTVADIFTGNSSARTSLISSGCDLTSFNTELSLSGSQQLVTSDCPLNGYGYYYQYLAAIIVSSDFVDQSGGWTFTWADYPSLAPLFDPSWQYSLLNSGPKGLCNWLGLGWQIGKISFNIPVGYTQISEGDMDDWLEELITALIVESINKPGGWKLFLPGDENDGIRRLAAKAMIYSVLSWVGPFFEPTTTFGGKYMAVLVKLTYREFATSDDTVMCAPLGQACNWQWGHMSSKYGSYFSFSPMTDAKVQFLVDFNTKVDTNPLQIYFLKNSAVYYNSFLYCSRVMDQDIDFTCPSTDYEFCVSDGTVSAPATYWGFDNGVDISNRTKARTQFKGQSAATRSKYVSLLCNMSSLLYSVFPESTDFHDNYVVRYLNKRRDPQVNHTFTTGNWKELGWAQFGGGFVTYSITKVKSIYQVTRDAMWHFGPVDYWYNLIEFSTWAGKTGYPVAWIYNVTEAKNLLYALSDNSDHGTEFRKHLVYVATTLVGDGTFIDNGIGAVGERAFTPEANYGRFLCPESRFSSTCALLDQSYQSSADICRYLDSIYIICRSSTFSGNVWVSNCARFETTLTSPTGIQCDNEVIFGKPHPYTKKRGNVVYEMLFTMTTALRLRSGLWCHDFDTCDYSWGGLVTTVRVRQMLFEGYSEPSVLTYLNIKHRNDGIRYECVQARFQASETQQGAYCSDRTVLGDLICGTHGVTLNLPGGLTKDLIYGETPKEEYFAPYFEVVQATGEMLWSFASSPEKVARAAAVRSTGTRIVRLVNPHWAAYPAHNSEDVEFNKFYQCQGRFYGGMPYLFNSCVNRLDTGRANVSLAKNVQMFMGNESIYWFAGATPASVNGTFDHEQAPMSLWDGFFTYPYSYNGTLKGPRHTSFNNPTVYHKKHAMTLQLDQSQYVYDWEYNIDTAIPYDDSYTGNSRENPKRKILRTRKFEESALTWAGLKSVGEPVDSFGMPYKTPVAMASLERLGGLPLFAGTPHAYGNLLWGGSEYDHVQGMDPDQKSQKSFIDYEPVTGKFLRQVVRQSVNLRLEQGPLYPNVFSSQQRCITPTKSFSYYTGYGCFAYVPLLWYEDGRVINTESFFRTYDHYYRRPERALLLQTIGTVVGVVCIIAGLTAYAYEWYHRRKFNMRVYVD